MAYDKKKILWEIANEIMKANNKLPMPEFIELCDELKKKYGVSRNTILRYMREAGFFFRVGFPLSESYLCIIEPEVGKAIKRYGVNIHKYIDAIQNPINREALIYTIDIIDELGIQPKGYSSETPMLIKMLREYGWEGNENDSMLWRYIRLTYHLLNEFVNPLEYLIEDFYDEPIDLHEELEEL